ncbi:putative Cytochrome P450, family 87, subfamily A, polypeptide 9 [Hibiscus syriacus]|uniref:Cytochrome P450, family 87, subfamily A, polypeptide 9 n=3 Tax=Hibiscus syriacus TaxID=106335 RepID=A0A6A3B9L1_HIBSY|nr:putative Cytochrome P450, family 87, subfamily A, polypeptide 9 [Hibiscus syriacus]
MKRKKRKRVEDTADVASYMSHHDIFSYYENKKSVVAAPAAFLSVDDWGVLDNKTVNGYDDDEFNDGSPFESRDGDNLTEHILQKTELLRSRIRALKTRMDKVVNETQKLSSINILSSLVPSDALNNPESHCAEKDYKNSLQCTTSQHATESVMWDNIMPESSLLDHGDVSPVPDLIRSMSQRMLAISSENIESEILIPNEAAKEELLSFGSAISQRVEKSKAVALVHTPGDNLQMNTSLEQNAQPHFFKSEQADNGRTSGVKRSDLGRWSRRSSG